MKPDEWVTVERNPVEAVAELVRGRLETEGIRAVLRGNRASGSAGPVNELNLSWNNPLGGVEVRVHQNDEAAARAILAESYGARVRRVNAPAKFVQIGVALWFAVTGGIFASAIHPIAGVLTAILIFVGLLVFGSRTSSQNTSSSGPVDLE